MPEVCIVGGGPAGLLAAARLSSYGFDVHVYEEHREVGYPEHCTGIVRDDFLALAGYSELKGLELSSYTGGTVELSGRRLSVDTGRVKAIMIDRPVYEKKLMEIAASNGTVFELGKKATIAEFNGETVVLTQDGRKTPKLVLGARGPASNPRLKCIPGIQARVRLLEAVDDNHVRVFFSDYIPGFFGWFAPYSGRFAKIGVASSSNPRHALNQIRGLMGVKHELLGYFGGKVVVGGLTKTSLTDKYVPIGDEGGFVKPLTGGGLGLGAQGVLELCSEVRSGHQGLPAYRSWLRSLRPTQIISEIIAKYAFLSNTSVKARLFERVFGIKHLGYALGSSDFDDHVSALLNILRYSLQ